MPVERLFIKDFLPLSKGKVVLDVRSPGEYNHAHIPGAINLPLFTDEERKVIGTTYKQQSREQAIKVGLDFFGPKMRKMVEEVESLVAGSWPMTTGNGISDQRSTATEIFIYCWRGGMRSRAVAWLLNLYGFKVYTLSGGYKSFRNYVLQSFEQEYNFKILGGFTGAGKTEVLNQLARNGEATIDLEKIACHKGSAFGKTDKPQPTQEMFENLLASELNEIRSEKSKFTIDDSRLTIWLEDESQRIGNINIPNALWNTMRRSPICFLDAPFEERLKHIIEEYGNADREKLSECIVRISKRLGPLETKTSLQLLEEGNIQGCFSILLQYYDKKYQKGLISRENLSSLLSKFKCETVTSENAFLLQDSQAVISMHE